MIEIRWLSSTCIYPDFMKRKHVFSSAIGFEIMRKHLSIFRNIYNYLLPIAGSLAFYDWLTFSSPFWLVQLPLTATLSFSSSHVLFCHSSSVSFSFPHPHGTTSVWECCTCPVERDSDKQCNETTGNGFTSLCLVSI